VKFILLFSLLFTSFSHALVTDWYSTLPERSRFKTSDQLKSRVDFWAKIYSQYSKNQGVFHLVDDPSVILGEIDWSNIADDPDLNAFQKEKLIEKKVEARKKELLRKHKIKNARAVRMQRGLKEEMRKAFFISGKYLESMEEIFMEEGLPVELTRLVFVESSFNIYAQSKVGASGLWQIMPRTAGPSKYIKKNYDKRNHPYYATILAAQILKDNYRSLKSWPLAITAYNHGLTGVKRRMRKAGTVKIEELIESDVKSRNWGFASKNYYPSFLAVLQVERNAKELFGDDMVRAESLSYKEYKLPVKTKSEKVLSWFNGSLTRFKQMNPHLNWSAIRKKKSVPAGVSLMIPEENFGLVRR
jgi:membrane-bound lytic murein transglycosylase D